MRLIPLILLLCAGCAVSPQAQEEAALHPAALVDAYLVAHGMAESYAESPDANPAIVGQLEQLDLQAARAVRTRDDGATAQAVAALTDFAARQSAASTP
jgi:hypothetical protein